MLTKETISTIQKFQIVSALILISCTAGFQQPVDAKLGEELSHQTRGFKESYGTERLDNGNYNFVAWKSNKFSGSARRRWWYDNENSSGAAQVDIDLDVGGYDFGVSKENSGKTKLKNASTNKSIYLSMKYNLWNDGWWMWGVKTVVSPSTSRWPWSANHYEVYIVEKSEKDPSYFAKNRTYWGTRYHNGSDYKFYTNHHNNHKQLFIVRQNYRNRGWINVGKIFRNDLIELNIIPDDYYVHGFKSNVEFFGKNDGYFQHKDLSLITW